ncbi:MAG TPA: CFI-box-CTERM domain-containing protein [Nitrososphaera sp.]
MLKRQCFASLVLVYFIATTITSSGTVAYGHGIGADQSLPMSIDNRSVAVSASLKPDFIESKDQPKLMIRTFDTGNNSTIPGISYRIAVEFKNETLFNQRFKSSDGLISANLQPEKNISGWQIVGKESASPDEPIEASGSTPITIKSKIFTDGGLYHIIVTLETSSTGLSVDSDRKFDLYVTVGRTFSYDNIETQEGKVNMSARTYYDEIKNFTYDSGNSTISFSMPFIWRPDFVSQVPVVHVEIQFPKSIKELQSNSYRGTINGKDLESRAVLIDDFTDADSRIVHFVIPNDMLTSLAQKISGNVANFSLSPIVKPKFPMDITSLDNKYVFELSWGPDIIETGTPTTFTMNIQDAGGNLLSGSSFDFVITQNGSEVYRQNMQSNTGDFATQYTFTEPGSATLTASDINGGGKGASASINLIVQQGTNNATSQNQQQSASSQPQQQQPSGCLIATAAFGSELTPQVQFLRNFRDHYILSTVSGSAFMNTFNSIYYSFSPQVASYERSQPWLQTTIRTGLYPLFGILLTSEKAYSVMAGDIGSILAGTIAGSLIGAVYLWPAGLAVSRKINSSQLIFVAAGALAVLAVTLVAAPTYLPISTAVFVVAVAGASAIAVAKVIREITSIRHLNKLNIRIFHRNEQ